MVNPEDSAPLPPLPLQNQVDWFPPRDEFDREVKRRLEGHLSPDQLSATMDGHIGVASSRPQRSEEIGVAVRLTSSRLSNWQAAVSDVYSGTADAKLLCVGDSTTAGVGVSGGYQHLPGCYPWQLANALDALGITATPGLSVPGPNSSNTNAMFSLGSGWKYGGSDGQPLAWGRNSCYRATSSSIGNLVFTPTNGVEYDSFDIYYVKSPGNGELSVSISGGGATVIDTDGAQGITKTTVTAAASTSHVVTMTRGAFASEPIHVVGVEPYLSTKKRVRVGNAGVGSSNAYDWARNSAGTGAAVWDARSAIKAYAPDLTIISLGLNDARDSRTVGDWLTDMGEVIAAAQVSGDVLIIPPFPVGEGASSVRKTLVPTYISAIRRVNLPAVNIAARWGGDYTNSMMEEAGLRNGDGVHLSAAGYADLAKVVASLLASTS